MENETNNQIIANKNQNLGLNIKVGFYTLIIFAIVVTIWIYTNPLFKKQNQPQVTTSPQAIAKVQSLGQSFSTMWVEVKSGVQNLRK